MGKLVLLLWVLVGGATSTVAQTYGQQNTQFNGGRESSSSSLSCRGACHCPQEYIPFCATDGRQETTYSNKCLYDCAQRCNPGLRIKFEGVCAKPYVHRGEKPGWDSTGSSSQNFAKVGQGSRYPSLDSFSNSAQPKTIPPYTTGSFSGNRHQPTYSSGYQSQPPTRPPYYFGYQSQPGSSPPLRILLATNLNQLTDLHPPVVQLVVDPKPNQQLLRTPLVVQDIDQNQQEYVHTHLNRPSSTEYRTESRKLRPTSYRSNQTPKLWWQSGVAGARYPPPDDSFNRVVEPAIAIDRRMSRGLGYDDNVNFLAEDDYDGDK